MIPLVDLKKQYLDIKEEIDEAIKRTLESTSFIMGPEIKSFEENFARYCGSKHCKCVANGTVAVELALKACGIKPGDEVITVPNTFIATSESVTNLGASIKFVDIDPETYLMDPKKLEESVTPKTKAVIPVHLYGQICDMKEIKEVADKHGLKIIEDAAQAHGAEYHGKKSPIFDVAAFSFFPAKILGCYGDGGSVVTNDPEIDEKISLLRDHGRISKYEHKIEGHNYRLDTIQAAVLNVKLKHLDSWVEKRRKNVKVYNELLSKHVLTPVERKYNKHSYYLYVIRVSNREKVQEFLKIKGIMTGIHYPIPLHLQPAYKHLRLFENSFPNAEKAAKEILSIPLFPELTKDEIVYISKQIISAVKGEVR